MSGGLLIPPVAKPKTQPVPIRVPDKKEKSMQPLARKPELLDEMDMPAEETMDGEGEDMASISDIEQMTETDTGAGEMDLSSIPDEVLQAELNKRLRKPPQSSPSPGVLPPQEVTGTESSNLAM